RCWTRSLRERARSSNVRLGRSASRAERSLHCVRLALDHTEQDLRRAIGNATLLFPFLDSAKGKMKPLRERLLRETQGLSNTADIGARVDPTWVAEVVVIDAVLGLPSRDILFSSSVYARKVDPPFVRGNLFIRAPDDSHDILAFPASMRAMP